MPSQKRQAAAEHLMHPTVTSLQCHHFNFSQHLSSRQSSAFSHHCFQLLHHSESLSTTSQVLSFHNRLDRIKQPRTTSHCQSQDVMIRHPHLDVKATSEQRRHWYNRNCSAHQGWAAVSICKGRRRTYPCVVMKGASLVVILETLLLPSCFTHLKEKVQELVAISLKYQGYLGMPVLLANSRSPE